MNDSRNKLMTKLIVVLSIAAILLFAGIVALSVQYENSEANAVIIYYKGYSTPRIRYRFDTEPWGPLDGEPMATNNDSKYKNYTHKFVMPLKKYKYILVSFNDGAGNLDDNNGEAYEFKRGSYLYDNGEIIKLDKTFQAAKFTVTNESAIVNQSVGLSVSTINGKGPFMYKFVAQIQGGEEVVIQDYSNSNTAQWIPTIPGEYTLVALAKDSKGATAEKKIPGYMVTSLAINGITPSVESPQQVGASIALNMYLENSGNLELICYYEISNGDSTIKLEATDVGAADWTPSEPGNYTITAKIESGELKAEKAIEYVIEEEEVELSRLSVYYYGLENPSIYYKVVNDEGDFTSMQMVYDESKPGYKYRADMDVPFGSQVLIYFSDGFAYTDNNNGQNYILTPGVYGILNGQMANLEANEDYEDIDDDDDDGDDGHSTWEQMWPFS
jgi:hypothetical protein